MKLNNLNLIAVVIWKNKIHTIDIPCKHVNINIKMNMNMTCNMYIYMHINIYIYTYIQGEFDHITSLDLPLKHSDTECLPIHYIFLLGTLPSNP